MKNIFSMIGSIFSFIIDVLSKLFSKKSDEIRKLNKIIRENKRAEKEVENQLKKLSKDKVVNKREIAKLKRKLTNTKKEIERMENAYTKEDIDDAIKFLKKFANKG